MSYPNTFWNIVFELTNPKEKKIFNEITWISKYHTVQSKYCLKHYCLNVFPIFLSIKNNRVLIVLSSIVLLYTDCEMLNIKIYKK